MDAPSKGSRLKEIHADLARKYSKHAATIDRLWRSLDSNQRVRCMKAGAADGVVLKHSRDPSMGVVCKILPEWNLRDVAESGPDFFLDLLTHRATKSLFEQYCDGVGGGPGDHALIDHMVRTRGLRHIDPFRNCYTFFLDEERYGQSCKLLADRERALAAFAPAIQAGLCVPQSTGEFILERQFNLLSCLNIIIEDILDQGSQTRDRKELPKKSDKVATDALAKLTIRAPPPRLAPADLLNSAREQKATLDEYLDLLCTEPVVLAHAVSHWFFSRPELLADEKGRRLPAHTDKHISGAFLEAVDGAVKAAAIWNYICRLLELLESQTTDKVYRAIILQEISNVCHLEYGRTRALFKRHVQTGTGSKWFNRLSGAYDKAGNARVSMKGNPEDVASADPQLHYTLRLCQADTSAFKAVGWIKKLAEFQDTHPLERDRVDPRETNALADLAVVVSFIQDLSSVISMPSVSRKKGQMFVSRSQDLEAELNQLKSQVDLLDFALPIDNLLEPGMAEGALKALDRFIIEKTGTKMGFLYQDLVEDCFSDLKKQYEHEKAKAELAQKEAKAQWTPFPVPPPEPRDKRVEQRRQKEKTRPAQPSVYEIIPPAEPPVEPQPAAPKKTVEVSSSTAEVFSTLFDKAAARGSVSWVAFEGAMADLGFSVMPKYGSVYTFLPPEGVFAKRSFTVHRPHGSRIEGYTIPIFARRLKRVYGWDEKTFVTA